jgi:hypothetical protein
MLPDADELAKELLDSRPLGAPMPTDGELRDFLNQKNVGTEVVTEDEDVELLRHAVKLRHRPFPPPP